MDIHDFTNRLRILSAIDRHELLAAGLDFMRDDRGWTAFRTQPAKWLCAVSDHNAETVWALVESRCKPQAPAAAPHVLDGKLEPEAREPKANVEASILSAAISLKRIADAITGNDPGVIDVFEDAGAAFRKGWER